MGIENCTIDHHARIPFPELVNVYGCMIGERSFVGPFVEIQAGTTIGSDCKIESHTFICADTKIGHRVFIGHNVTFCNDKLPFIARRPHYLEPPIIEDDVVIGSGSTVLPGVTVGRGALVGAGSVVTKDVEPGTTVAGNPAREV